MEPKKPTFIIIGCQKCGTTALHSILGAHPDCCMSRPKEVNYFNEVSLDYCLEGGGFEPNPNFEKGWEWYQRAFSHYRGEPVVGEASTAYANRSHSPETARRIYDFNPEAKIIYMVRHPFERQISAWQMYWAEAVGGKTYSYATLATRGFEHWMRWCEKGWSLSRYHFQLQAYFKYFPPKQILVSFLEDWKLNKDKETGRIMCFLGLNPSRRDRNFRENANLGKDRRQIARPFLKKIRQHRLSRKIVPWFPESWREWARRNIAIVTHIPPVANLSPQTAAEYMESVRLDAEVFLKEWGKPAGFWAFDMKKT